MNDNAMKKAAIFSCFLVLLWGLTESKYVCSYCSCLTLSGPHGPVAVDCKKNFLHLIPPVTEWPQNITSLDLGNSNISSLEVEMTHGHLMVLKLNSNRISSIHPSVFGGLDKLKFLDLSNNHLQAVESRTFYGLEGLEILNMSHNKLTQIPENAFINLYELEELNLAGNPIVHVGSILFKKMLNLKRLDISATGTFYLREDMFSMLNALEFLDLSANDFQTVPTNSLRSASALKRLNLNENPIESLTKTSFTKLEHLEELDISYMGRLESIGARTFSDLKSLRVLRANSNHRLEYIDRDAFADLFTAKETPTLQEVSLEMNRLSQIDGNMFPCSKIEILNLQKNPWKCDCGMKWFRKCPTPEVYTMDLKCQSPAKYKGILLVNIAEEDLLCESHSASTSDIHQDRILRLTSVVLGSVLLVALALTIILVLKWRSIRSWWKSKRKGPGAVYYVRTHTNPMDT